MTEGGINYPEPREDDAELRDLMLDPEDEVSEEELDAALADLTEERDVEA